MGDPHHLHHLHTFGLKKLPGHKDVEAHAHAQGRYKVISHKGDSTHLAQDKTAANKAVSSSGAPNKKGTTAST